MNNKKVVLLTNNKCTRCTRFSMVLTSKEIEHDKDLFTKEPYISDIKNKGLRALPIIKLGNEYIQYTNMEETLAKVRNYLAE